MRFQLPQFIETETKLVGPFTLKQFIWIAAGGAILYLAFLILGPGIWFILIAILVGAGAISMAFVKIDGMPLLNYILYALNFTISPKRYLFKKNSDKIDLPY